MTALPPKRSLTDTVSVGTGRKKGLIPMQRIFQAAGMGRLEASWSSTPSTVDSWIYQHWSTLVARSREQSENGDHMRKFIQLVRDNVAGPLGFTLQAQVKDPNGTQDTLASTALEDGWARFREKGVFDVTGQLSGADADRLVATSVATDGEVIAIKRYGRELNEFGFAIQIVDPMLLDPQHFEKLSNGNAIRHGIEFTPDGRPVAYYFREYDERQVGYISTSGSRNYQRVPAENVIHIFITEKVGQKRGLPWGRTALWRLRMFSGFEDAAITNARVGAAKMGFFKDVDAENDEDDALPMDCEAGVFENIGNREFVDWNPQFPEQSIDPFSKSLLRSIASGLGVSYNNLASDLSSVNFSSIRQGALDEREVWKGLQEWLITSWCKEVYKAWLERALLAGTITVANRPLRVDRIAKYKAITFQGRRWAWIDPQAEMSANEKAIALRIKSTSEVIRETTTRDPVDVWDEVERDEAELKRRNIMPIPQAGAPATPTTTKANDPES
jgi:lambda family phage portal protein